MTPGGKPKKATTFQEFESITSDAWDVGDDDDELLAMAAQNLNIEVVMETANQVILWLKHTQQSVIPGCFKGLYVLISPVYINLYALIIH